MCISVQQLGTSGKHECQKMVPHFVHYPDAHLTQHILFTWFRKWLVILCFTKINRYSMFIQIGSCPARQNQFYSGGQENELSSHVLSRTVFHIFHNDMVSHQYVCVYAAPSANLCRSLSRKNYRHVRELCSCSLELADFPYLKKDSDVVHLKHFSKNSIKTYHFLIVI